MCTLFILLHHFHMFFAKDYSIKWPNNKPCNIQCYQKYEIGHQYHKGIEIQFSYVIPKIIQLRKNIWMNQNSEEKPRKSITKFNDSK